MIERRSPLGDGQIHDFGLRLGFRFEHHQADGDRQLEAAWPARSWIEIEHALVVADPRLVRVAEQYRRKLRCRRIEMKRVQIVQHVKIMALEEQHLGFRQTAALAAAIDIAANGCNRSDAFERFQDFRITDIAEMQDAFNSGKFRKDLRPQQAVRVADNSKLHRWLNSEAQRLLILGVLI